MPDELLGKAVKCPSCGARCVVSGAAPDPGDEVSVPTGRASAPGAVRSGAIEEEPPPPPSRRSAFDDDDDDAGGPSRRRRRKPKRSGFPTGLVLGLAGGGCFLLLLVVGGVIAVVLIARGGGAIPDSDWQDFSPPGGQCKLRMPGTPVDASYTLAGGNGHKYMVNRQNSVVFVMAYVDLPGGGAPPPGILDQATTAEQQNMANSLSGKVVGQRNITLGTHQGREFQIESSHKRGSLVERVYLVKLRTGYRLYLIGVGGNTIKAGIGDAVKFLDSFQIVE
jgi:hypothetical protein